MERLTNKAWQNFDPWECCGQDKYCQRGCHDPGGCTKGCIVPQLYARLGAYEDTGLTPEEVLPKDKADEIALKLMQLADLESICSYTRLRELAEADKDGRVVVLPCQSGEHVFALLDGQKRVRECEVKYAVLDGWLKVFYLAPIDDPGTCIVRHSEHLASPYFLPARRRRKHWRR